MNIFRAGLGKIPYGGIYGDKSYAIWRIYKLLIYSQFFTVSNFRSGIYGGLPLDTYEMLIILGKNRSFAYNDGLHEKGVEADLSPPAMFRFWENF